MTHTLVDVDSTRQKRLYERIHDDYESHYYDRYSTAYRKRFIYDLLLRDVDLNGLNVADLACGSGHTTLYLKERYPRVNAAGFDISSAACQAYKANTDAPSFQTDLTRKQPFTAQFDAAIVIGGLHHCVADLRTTFENIGSLLRPGGLLLMMEPNAESFLEPLRKLWYRWDKRLFDAPTEHALDHAAMLATASDLFRLRDACHLGGPAYFAVFNSLILRIPSSVKCMISPPLLWLENGWNRLPMRALHGFFLARWTRL